MCAPIQTTLLFPCLLISVSGADNSFVSQKHVFSSRLSSLAQCLHIYGANDVIEVWSGHGGPRVHSDAPLALAVGIQEGTLHVEHRIRCHVLLHVDLNCKGLIRMTVGNHQQILTADEEVSIELGDFPPSGDSNPHHRFPAHVASEHVHQLRLELLLRHG